MSQLVSVVLPVYNAEKYIGAAIKSIIEQTYQNWELIVIDDGSTDCTREEILKFTDSRVSVFQLDHSGVASAANFGMNQCKGELIARMDSDDFSFPDRLVKQVEFLKAHNAIDVVSCLIEYGGNQSIQGGYAHHVDWLNTLISSEEISNNRFVDSPIANPSVMFRTSLLKDFGNYQEGETPEDYEFWMRLLHADVKFGKVPEILFRWSDYETRLTRNHQNYLEENFQKVKAEYFKKWYDSNGGNRPIWIWGNSKVVRRKVQFLIDQALEICGFIDIQRSKQSDCIHYIEISKLNEPIILSYVADRNGRLQIEKWLLKNNFQPGIDFYMMN